MKYIHYWHFADQWYMYVNDNPNHERVFSGNESNSFSYYWIEKFLIQNSMGLTKHQVKEKLKEQYPNGILIKEIAYHEGARWRGNKKGSRNKK